MDGSKNILAGEVLALKDLIQFLKGCKNKKISASEINTLLRFFYSDESQFKEDYPKIYQKLDPEVISLLKKEYQYDNYKESMLKHIAIITYSHFSDRNHLYAYTPSSIRKALKIAEQKLKEVEGLLDHIKMIKKNLEEKLEHAKEIKKRRKLELKAKLTMNQSAIQRESARLLENIEKLIVKIQELVNTSNKKVQSTLNNPILKEILMGITARFLEKGNDAEKFTAQMKKLYSQILNKEWDVIRKQELNLLEKAIFRGISAIALGDSEDFITKIDDLHKEIFDEEPDLLLTLNWWLKCLESFEHEFGIVVKHYQQDLPLRIEKN
ncbi:MAG: hypothetical protein HWN65_22855 [Candidatus Helarchaeota archaeon]|nr:hypothetical protein [Candidatus Helarchaeota archaeon]